MTGREAHTARTAARTLEAKGANAALVCDLYVLASRLEEDQPRLAPDRDRGPLTPAERHDRERWYHNELVRVERQRTLFVMLTPGRATEALKLSMLDRAFDLLTEGRTEPADALLEFLPSGDVEKLLDRIDPPAIAEGA